MLTKVGKYEIIEKIGVGGFGTVYKGRDPYIKRLVAIKTCQSDEDEIRKRFFREAEFAGNLQQRNITTIYDFGLTDEGLPYIVQEFLTGEDLDKKIKRKDPLPVALRLRWLIEICEGLQYAHASGIVHRDIKPSNVRVLEDGRVKIMDFGIAKSMVSESTLTQTGITLGTASYLAPEQIRGEPVDARTDIFSLGVLAYELFTYQKPFTGEHISTVLYRIMNESPPPASELNPDVPPALDRLVARSLEKDRQNRYASCAEMRDDARAVLDGLSDPVTLLTYSPVAGPATEATGPTPSSGISPALSPHDAATTSARREQPASAAGAGAPAPRSGAVADVPLRQVPATTGPHLSPPDEGGGALKIFLAAIGVLVVVGGAIGYFVFGPGAAGRGAGRQPAATPAVASGTPAAAPTAAPAVESTASTASTAPTAPTPAPTAAPTPAPPRPGAVVLVSNAYAKVSIDGQPRGGVLRPTRITLPAGTHKARFEIAGLPPLEKEFEVRAGESTEVRATFPPRGQLWVTVNADAAGAEIRLDGKLLGHAKGTSLKQIVPAGTYTVEAFLPGFQSQQKTVVVPEEDVGAVKFELQRK